MSAESFHKYHRPTRFSTRDVGLLLKSLPRCCSIPHRCLLLYPQPAWLPIEEKINSLPSFDPVASSWKRLLLGHAEELELDGSGRLLVSPVLRQLAGLEKEAMLVGQGSHFELWSMEGWRAQMEQALAPGNALPATLADFSL